jgi:hypothetical protein
MTIWRMRIACWIPKATNTRSECAILTAFPLQQRLHERASTLRYNYIACLVHFPAHIDWEDQIIKDVVGGTCSTLVEKRNTYQGCVGKHGGTRPRRISSLETE